MLKALVAAFLSQNEKQEERKRLLKEYKEGVRALEAHLAQGERMLNDYRRQIAAAKAKQQKGAA